MTHINRLTAIISDCEREAEHERRINRAIRSQQVYAAAQSEAIERGITLTCECSVYRMWDAKHHIAFYPLTQVVMRSILGRQRLDRIDLSAECDVFDITLMFLAGKFLSN